MERGRYVTPEKGEVLRAYSQSIGMDEEELCKFCQNVLEANGFEVVERITLLAEHVDV